MVSKCTACNGTSIDYDPSAGLTICTSCGIILEENNIVTDEISFNDPNGSHGPTVQGSFLGSDQVRARIGGGGIRFGGGGGQGTAAGAGGGGGEGLLGYDGTTMTTMMGGGVGGGGGMSESRENTIRNGKLKMSQLGGALRLVDHHIERGSRFFNLAVDQGFTKGRRTLYVVGACLYIVCRLEKTTHMLIDFSDVLQINVFTLGSTYLKLVQALSLSSSLPLIDPSVYISRFASLLEFGSETSKVASDAIRLVKRFDRDWMSAGRRPAGICGACLLLAARMNNFRRSILEVVQVVKVADVTLKKRLEEFRRSGTGKLTVEEFRTIWLDEAEDPPSYQMARQKEREERDDAFKTQDDEGDAVDGNASEAAMESRSGEDAETENGEEGEPVRKKARIAGPDEDLEYYGERRPGPPPPAPGDGKDDDLDSVTSGSARVKAHARTHREKTADPLEDPTVEQALTAELNSHLESGIGQELAGYLEKEPEESRAGSVAPSMGSGLGPSEFGGHQESEGGMEEGIDEKEDTTLYHDDLDDEELDDFLLDEEEVEMKTRVWMEYNKDYLEKIAERQRFSEGQGPPKPRKPRKRKRGDRPKAQPGATAAEAAGEMLKKKFSRKINYDVLEGMFDTKNSAASFGNEGSLEVGGGWNPSRGDPLAENGDADGGDGIVYEDAGNMTMNKGDHGFMDEDGGGVASKANDWDDLQESWRGNYEEEDYGEEV